ncbi:MAG: CDC48 family AAA ATPase [Thaumarchaeota archaeon]|jgi:transitional endoplasmic reticulum ATPase|nr:CDC48 family AAA ATPase [Candidatus Terraquivivens yellowstonensis]MCL7394695.1 CDC48 family AAA ATPase [Candidatus Terraquivivens yellowstonensis]MCL7398537.1 CDC48 family AAA ATPase [Candidatus Terraquivivens yellowstonensis]MCL7399128.1 CDC48 family AAA ATPase [Candidatus Terraquivivens yellowstonensis]
MSSKELRLRVVEAKQRDVGYGIARIDKDVGASAGLTTGDIIEIRGKKLTAATLWLGYTEDEKDTIRIDGYIRSNAGVSLNDYVTVRKAQVKEAQLVVLAPVNNSIKPDENFVKLVKSRLIEYPTVQKNIVPVLFFGNLFTFAVIQTRPMGIVKITPRTKLIVQARSVQERVFRTSVTYEDIGGLQEQIQRIRELIELPLRYPELFQKLGIDPPKGILLYGPPGCGKTLLAKAVATEADANFILINGPEIMNKYYGETEARLREIFRKAEEEAPSIIFIDEIDAIAPKRSEVTGEVEKRVVAQLLALMDGLESRGSVIVIGATNRPNALDPALRRPGRFDREIEIGIPDKKARKEILDIHTRGMPLDESVDLDKLADITRGYTGADIAALCREAAMRAIRRILPSIDFSEDKISPELLNSLTVTMKDFLDAYKDITPTALREVEIETPTVRWDQIGGLEEVKQRLREAIEWPLKYPEKFERLGIKPPKGILLYGPPGCGKTLLAKAIATESEANFISIKGPEIFSKWVGESEKAIREIFRKARQAAPCIVFLDEIESIIPRKDFLEDSSGVSHRVASQLLAEMDGIEDLNGVVVVGATNRPDLLDPAILRPGRFDRLIYVPPPDEKARLQILKIYTAKMPLADDVSLEEIASMTEGYSGADLESLCREAALSTIRRGAEPEIVTRQDFQEALRIVKPSLSPHMTKEYEKIGEMLRSSEKPLTMIG